MNRVSVEVSDPARDDMLRIFAYIEQDSPQNAWAVLDAFEEAFERLSQMPLIGHTRADVTDKTLRFWAVKSHLIAYRYQNGRVEVSHVVHGARDLTRINWR